jgi:hypothetical protein
MEAGKLTKDEQVRAAARTTVCFFILYFPSSYFSHIVITDYAWSTWQWTHIPPVDAT